jgi:hypothetical protein
MMTTNPDKLYLMLASLLEYPTCLHSKSMSVPVIVSCLPGGE